MVLMKVKVVLPYTEVNTVGAFRLVYTSLNINLHSLRNKYINVPPWMETRPTRPKGLGPTLYPKAPCMFPSLEISFHESTHPPLPDFTIRHWLDNVTKSMVLGTWKADGGQVKYIDQI